MFCVPSMVDLGLLEGQGWPNESYRKVAQHILIDNPTVNRQRQMIQGVQSILKIPSDRINRVTLIDLEEFGFRIARRSSGEGVRIYLCEEDTNGS
jgi:hypothetical protein